MGILQDCGGAVGEGLIPLWLKRSRRKESGCLTRAPGTVAKKSGRTLEGNEVAMPAAFQAFD